MALKKIYKEPRDFKSYLTIRKVCIILSLVIAFFVDYYPLVLGASIPIWFALYLLFFTYSFAICMGIYCVFVPRENRIKKADFTDFLINHGYDLCEEKRHRVRANLFKNKVLYIVKRKDKTKVTLVFDIKNNIYYEVKKKAKK